MNSERVKQLLKFLQQEPEDPFILYALANEYLGHDLEKSKEYFDQLLTHHPHYLPTYYHAGHLYLKLEEVTKARQIYEKGIDLARQQNDQLALRELSSVYDQIVEDET